MTTSLTLFIQGMMLCGSLIIAIGAQNAYVLRQGLLHNHIGLVVVFCSLCDATLMSIGVWGLGELASLSPWILKILTTGGALFLLLYGLLATKRAWLGGGYLSLEQAQNNPTSWRRILATLAAMTLLNPHVYIDTVILIGGVATGLANEMKIWFWLGASSMSFIWFSTLGFGVRLLLPLFRCKRVWQALDALIALMMFYLAWQLTQELF